ncbi:hypothetical protein BMS3Bbin02_01444 [bacterium BMS3Bbin02]|nr:hypothetical protein BMS3Bbin02_01444 [bacterium BMS3Bbin02]
MFGGRPAAGGVFVETGAVEVAAYDTFHRDDLGAVDKHRTSRIVGDLIVGDAGDVVRVGADEVVWRVEQIEPVEAHPGEDLTLVGDGSVEHDVECGDTVGGDDDEPRGVDFVDLTDLS